MLEPQSLGFDAFWFDVGSIGGNVPDKLVFFIIEIQECNFCPDNARSNFLRDVRFYLPNYTASQGRIK